MSKLRIANGIDLPIDTVTQTIAILAKRRAGKSHTMRRIAEQLFKAGQQIVIIDPKGDQWGIRSSADGKRPGLPVVILGGEHGDAPLEVGSGDIVAKLVVVERVSVLLDLSTFRKHEIATFMTAFLETLYRLKAREEYRTPVMLVIDEADAIAPQKPQANEACMLGAAEDIVRRGGQRGIGCTLVTQRSAVLNKNVLTQAQMLIVLRTIAPQDLAAMNAWIDVHGTPNERKVLMESLPALPVGDAWFWSPGWPTEAGIFKRAHVYPIETFDSGTTPKPGEKKVAPKNLADVDLDALKKQMAATIEKAKQDDPKALRARIQELERELQTAKKRAEGAEQKAAKTQAPVVTVSPPGAVDKMSRAQLKALQEIVRLATKALNGTATVVAPAIAEIPPTDQILRKPVAERPAAPIAGLSTSQQRILDVLAQLALYGIAAPDKAMVAAHSGCSPTSGGYFNNLGKLRSAGFIEYPAGGSVALTDQGRMVANTPQRAPTLQELHDSWLQVVKPPQAAILRELIAAYPKSLDKSVLANKIGVSPTSGGYFNNLGRLRTLGAIDYPQPGHARASDVLFPSVE